MSSQKKHGVVHGKDPPGYPPATIQERSCVPQAACENQTENVRREPRDDHSTSNDLENHPHSINRTTDTSTSTISPDTSLPNIFNGRNFLLSGCTIITTYTSEPEAMQRTLDDILRVQSDQLRLQEERLRIQMEELLHSRLRSMAIVLFG
ncbi:hypothetical protein BJ165DRAFT_1074705 [Panaeolus papilionaceus]|nr:hypothetical protein BJ165DRAFT_1074705 [Panaeolus papilionaceus]